MGNRQELCALQALQAAASAQALLQVHATGLLPDLGLGKRRRQEALEGNSICFVVNSWAYDKLSKATATAMGLSSASSARPVRPCPVHP